ncbi:MULTISPECIES: hypothetical protein [Legionella]|uniref:Uncharacterized protein n=1 Tax=Legionella steelei TaxID=947033 RepID=A0A0W0ZLB2_9GAMM|nr:MULTISPECIES: hypothetical protein [Legionella]KTD70092.1 hypothetical protein Lste_0696 [Legionella steelei]MBN9226215.1 hypothetical protein [Legionella steelei]OJW12449.1 MAG: hypothetical protein BGO44_10340 [Legionella sp. 39-23]
MGSYGCAQEHCHCPCHDMHEEHHHHEHGHCHHGEHADGDDMKANYFLELADEAWEEVLKEKIKAHVMKTQGDRLDKLAQIVAEGNNHRWKNIMDKKQGYTDFMEEICKFFHESKK